MKIGITGATGHLGQLIIDKLKLKIGADSLVALVRNPDKVSDKTIETRFFDYDDPQALMRSLQGIDHLMFISANEIGKRKRQHENVIFAAKQAGVKWIVYTSLLHADRSTINLADEHRSTEATLKSSGIPYTILRNGWYTENYANAISGAVKAGAIIGSAGEGKISSASREDFAEAAVAVLTGNGHVGKVYELAGDDYYTLTDLAAEVSRQTGKNIPYRNLTESEYAETLAGFGLPEGLAGTIAQWDTGISQDHLLDDSKQLSQLIGRPTTPLSKSVKVALGDKA